MNSRVIGGRAAVDKIAAVRKAAVGILSDAEVSTLILSRIKARFIQGVAPDGTPWPGLLDSTIKRKRRKGLPRPDAPLFGTGRLYRSIKIIQGNNLGLLTTNTGVGVRIGVSDPIVAKYGRIHNEGLYDQEQRKFIGLSRLDVAAVAALLRRRLKLISTVG